MLPSRARVEHVIFASIRGRAQMAKPVFASYSHHNRDKYLERFFRDLEDEVKQCLQADPGTVVFFDEKIETAEYWRDKLANELIGCKSCVAVCSPAFMA